MFSNVLAYIGPGAGLGLIGALVGLVLAVLSALGFVVTWPLRGLLRRSKAEPPAAKKSRI